MIVQDVGLARLIRAITPDLEIHASTQMSVTSVEGVRMAAELGCARVILARELSVSEIAAIGRSSRLPLEVFVHGALCVAYSGQCLTSEALGGRSANRGECAQACRMPYEIVSDGRVVPMGDVQYLLSPQDLAAYDLVPELIRAGVASLKIEGRLKSPEYVAQITASYRKAIDHALAGLAVALPEEEVRAMEMTFSRGFSHGFLDGNNHKVLVRGDYAKKRGVFLGTVAEIAGDRVRIDLASPVKPGDGVVFDGSDARGVEEQGGRVYEVQPIRCVRSARIEPPASGPVLLGFGRGDLDVRKLRVGQRAWKTDDPEVTKTVRATFEGSPHRRVGVSIHAEAIAGQPLLLEATTDAGFAAVAVADGPLAVADRLPSDRDMLRAAVDRFGGTIYELREFSATIEGGPLAPKSLVNQLRRELVARLDAEAAKRPSRRLSEGSVLAHIRPRSERPAIDDEPELSALCRTEGQAEAALKAGAGRIYLEFADIRTYRPAVTSLRKIAGDRPIYLTTPRIEKPREAPIFRYLARQGADGLLVRNAGGMEYCARWAIPFVADFALNAANELTVDWLRAKGAARVVPSYDLSFEQLDDLLGAVSPDVLEIVIHQHMPMFHMEHCVFCAFLSPGTDKTNCGRPCDRHEVKLRDRVGVDHPLTADVGCRNTLFNAVPQTAAEYLPRLMAKGARRFRVEFLEDSPEAVGRSLGLYHEAILGRRDPRTLWRELRATGKYGVTRGQLAILS